MSQVNVCQFYSPIEGEVWRPIVGWPYNVSSLGRIVRADRVLSPTKQGLITLSGQGRKMTVTVKHLTDRAFAGDARKSNADHLAFGPVAESPASTPSSVKLSESTGFVYLYASADGRLVKIGYSTRLPAIRIQQLRSVEPLAKGGKLLSWKHGSLATERKLHRIFRAFRFKGEWFERVAAIEAWFDCEQGGKRKGAGRKPAMKGTS